MSDTSRGSHPDSLRIRDVQANVCVVKTLAQTGGGVPRTERGSSTFRLRSAHTWKIPWYGWAVVRFVRSTVFLPLDYTLHTNGRNFGMAGT